MNGLHLKMKRMQAGLRQYHVAAELGIPQTTLSYWENGHRPMPQGMQERILKAIEELQQERDSAGNAGRRLQKAGREETPGPNDGAAVERGEHIGLTSTGSDHGRGVLRHRTER